MKESIFFKVEKIQGKTYDCDCCGFYSSSGINIYLNEELVWEKYYDGHMAGNQTEDSILTCVVNAWNNYNLDKIEKNYTEEARNKWNEDHPGNGIARTTQSWGEYKEELINYQNKSKDKIIKSCENIPYDETLQVKMIALWIEEQSGEAIVVEESSASDSCDLNEEEFI